MDLKMETIRQKRLQHGKEFFRLNVSRRLHLAVHFEAFDCGPLWRTDNKVTIRHAFLQFQAVSNPYQLPQRYAIEHTSPQWDSGRSQSWEVRAMTVAAERCIWFRRLHRSHFKPQCFALRG